MESLETYVAYEWADHVYEVDEAKNNPVREPLGITLGNIRVNRYDGNNCWIRDAEEVAHVPSKCANQE